MKHDLKTYIINLTFGTLAWTAAAAEVKLVEYANILQGTDSTQSFSHGNTLPLVGVPWGMVAWSIENNSGRGGVPKWFFTPNGKCYGFRATHQPSPWMGDYGQFLVLPQAGGLRLDVKARTTDYDANTAILHPDYAKLDLKQDAITVELTGTERCGVFRLNYRQGATGRLIVNSFGANKDLASEIKVNGRTIYGISRANGGGVPKNFASYFVIKLDRDISMSEIMQDNGQGYVEFQTSPAEPVIVKIGTSFISWQQAEQNLLAETAGSFDVIHERVTKVWNTNLGKIEIEASAEQKATFYSCLYRALMFPQRLYELDAAGKQIHYSPYDGKIHDGVIYGGIGVWDGFRTTFPFLTLVYPAQLDEILQGFVNASVEGNGTLPEWPCPGYRAGMPGQHCAAIFADAVVKGCTGFDVAQAYAALRKGALVGLGREGSANYLKLGYLPGLRYGAVSTALDFAYDDWCVAQMASQLNHSEDVKPLMVSAQNYRKLWDPAVGFMRDKNADGTWVEPFDEFKWMGPYCESGPWQASWFVPHDPAGLAGLLGGRQAFAAKMEKLFSLSIPATHKPGIHEEAEMAAIPFGQCALSNQPSFHIPYLFTATGQPWKTQYWTRRACAELFNAGPKGFCGDEDNGSMASWYLLSSIGLYPFCPGTPEYLITSPLFTKATLHLADNKTLVIAAPTNSDKNIYIQKRLFNGKQDTKTWMRHQDLIKGGELHFEMGPAPKEIPSTEGDLPYSASKNDCPEHQAKALRAAEESIVLLKNNGVLPLGKAKLKRIAVIGDNANDAEMMYGNYNGTPSKPVTLLAGIKAAAPGCEVIYEKGKPHDLKKGEVASPAAAFEKAVETARSADVVIYIGGINQISEREGHDRDTIELPADQTEMLKALEAMKKPVVFVNCSGSPMAIPWEVENLPSIVTH